MEEIVLKPIGYIRSEHQEPEKTPIQPVFCQDCTGRVEVFPAFEEGLTDLEKFSHIILLFWLHKAGRARMLVTPFLESRQHGLFATRSPNRPNPVGLSIVRLMRREMNILHISGVDILDNTPLLDIKPYTSRFDCFPEAINGWQEGLDDDMARKFGRREYDIVDTAGTIP